MYYVKKNESEKESFMNVAVTSARPYIYDDLIL